MTTLIIPLEFLVEIITRSTPTHLFGVSYRSRVPNIPDFHPTIVRFEIGVLLKEKDPDEEKLKVFLYPETRHAEVWLKDEWDQSNSKRYYLKQDSEKYQNKLWAQSESKNKISDFVAKVMNIPKDQIAHRKLVDVLYELKHLPDALDIIPGLKSLLQEVGNLKKD